MERTKDLFMELIQDQHQAREDFINGDKNALDTLIYMRGLKKYADEINNNVKKFEDEFSNEITEEARQYNNSYLGFEISSVKGREIYKFDSIPEYNKKKNELKDLESTYKQAFLGFQKGTVQTVVENDVRYWIDENGELRLFPELQIGKSYIKFQEQKKK